LSLPLVLVSSEQGKAKILEKEENAARVHPIEVPELSEAEILEILTKKVTPALAGYFKDGKGGPARVKEEVIKLAYELGPQFHSGKSRLGGAVTMLGELLLMES